MLAGALPELVKNSVVNNWKTDPELESSRFLPDRVGQIVLCLIFIWRLTDLAVGVIWVVPLATTAQSIRTRSTLIPRAESRLTPS